MKYKAVFFDLDGTLTNPEEGILNSIEYAAEYYGVTTVRNDLRKYIGPPLLDTFTELVGADKAQEAVAKYREYFVPKGLYENEIYPGVEKILEELKNRGYVLCTASSKPRLFVERILDFFNIKKYFDFVGGATLDGRISRKEDVINIVIEETGFSPEEVLMVGDRMFDLTGAKEFGMDAVGVLYGFGSREELSSYDSIALIDNIGELIEILDKQE